MALGIPFMGGDFALFTSLRGPFVFGVFIITGEIAGFMVSGNDDESFIPRRVVVDPFNRGIN